MLFKDEHFQYHRDSKTGFFTKYFHFKKLEKSIFKSLDENGTLPQRFLVIA